MKPWRYRWRRRAPEQLRGGGAGLYRQRIEHQSIKNIIQLVDAGMKVGIRPWP